MTRVTQLPAMATVIVGALALAPAASAQPRGSGQLAIVGGMLIDGHGGKPIHNSVVLVENDTIKAIGTADTLQVPPGARVIDARGKTVMPGLIDLHSHSDIVGAGVYDNRFFGAAPVVPEGGWHPLAQKRFKEFAPAAEKHQLLAGVTMAREVGGFIETDLFIRDGINRGDFIGARRLVSGPWINFGDPTLTDKLFHTLNVNTTEGARQAAILLLDTHKVDLIKAYNNLTEDMVKAIVEEAHKRGKHVASHVSNADDLKMRIHAGIDSMEHMGGTTGGRYSQESLELMAERRLAVVPTLNVGLVYKETEEFPERLEAPEALRFFPADLADIIRRSARDFTHLRYFDGAKVENEGGTQARFKQLIDAGVRVLMGTEAGTPLNFHSSAAAREMVWMNRLGMSPMQVIVASTRGPAQFLRMDRKYGSIEVGKIADIIAVDGNPLHDMGVMHRVSVVIKDGVVHKGDAAARAPTTSSSASGRR